MVHVPFNPAMLATLKDKVVVLTGGATGIGRAAVLQFAGMYLQLSFFFLRFINSFREYAVHLRAQHYKPSRHACACMGVTRYMQTHFLALPAQHQLPPHSNKLQKTNIHTHPSPSQTNTTPTEAGAHIHYGDIHPPSPSSFSSTLPLSTTQRITYHHCDTTSYASQLSLFAAAHAAHNRIDIVVANAGVAHHRDIFALTANDAEWNDIEKEPSMREIDVNLKGVVFSARIGVWYLRKNGKEGEGEGEGGGDIVLVSSISGFKESGGLATYSASKHGVVGLMRGLHVDLIKENIRINVICPWMTSTFRFLFFPSQAYMLTVGNRNSDGHQHPKRLDLPKPAHKRARRRRAVDFTVRDCEPLSPFTPLHPFPYHFHFTTFFL